MKLIALAESSILDVWQCAKYVSITDQIFHAVWSVRNVGEPHSPEFMYTGFLCISKPNYNSQYLYGWKNQTILKQNRF